MRQFADVSYGCFEDHELGDFESLFDANERRGDARREVLFLRTGGENEAGKRGWKPQAEGGRGHP